MKIKDVWEQTREKAFDPDAHRKIPRDEVRMLYHLQYWDGPLSGVCVWKSERFYFKCLLEESVKTIVEPGDEEYVNPDQPVPEEWKWIFDYGYKSLRDMEDLNEDYYGLRYMGMFHLTQKEWQEEDKRHAIWRKYIGTHTDYDSNGRRNLGKVGSAKGGPCEWDAYKQAKKKLPSFPSDILDRPIYGYWVMGSDSELWKKLRQWKMRNKG